ncbi:MAG TPA: aminoglycoside phosphotransferase family protein [Gaiellaceae bacterium]|nr:aminoglycoside phosphotransferase family protein [Gaiellaceae bacterium]
MKAMHADELATDASLVRRLLGGQFPEWADLPIERVPSSGTDNALYGLGDDMVVRLPRIHWAVGGVDKDSQWLPKLAPLLPVAIPVPLAKGTPAEGYPWEWGIYPWLEGVNPTVDRIADSGSLTRDVVQFVDALHRVELADGPPTRRGAPLKGQDESARAALVALEGMIDTDAARIAWEEALATPDWSGPPVWIHGDLLPGNLLLEGGRLTGVIDWSLLGIGDPACDLIIAWGLLAAEARNVFRAELEVEDATWARGRGWALSIALIALPYYKDTNPVFANIARHLIREVLAENPGNLKL